MDDACYRTVALCRQFRSETLALKPARGTISSLTRESFAFLDFFSRGNSLTNFFVAAGIFDESERIYLRRFVKELLDRNVVKRSTDPAPPCLESISYQRPAFFLQAEKKIEDVALLCRLTQPATSQTGT